MKTLIILAVGLLSVGCATLTPEEKALRASVVGEYEIKHEDGETHKHIYLQHGDYEQYFNGEPHLNETQLFRFKWSISNGEIHSISHSGVINIFKINKDKSITQIAVIVDGKRKVIPKVSKRTYKKIK